MVSFDFVSVSGKRRRRPNGSLAAGDCMNGFFDLRNRILADLIHFDMRQVWHLIRRDHAIDDCGTINSERLFQFGTQHAGVFDAKAVSATGPRQGRKIRVGKLDGFAKRQDANALSFDAGSSATLLTVRGLLLSRRFDQLLVFMSRVGITQD
jgi:hypothetical protein